MVFLRSILDKVKALPTKLLADFFNHEFAPLHSAAASGNVQEVKALLAQGRPVDELSKGYLKARDCTPLYFAAQEGHLEVVKVLLEGVDGKGADIGMHCKNGATALHAAVSRGHHEVVEELVKRGAPLESVDQGGCTPLLCAAGWKDETIMELLIKNGANIHALDKVGATPLHICVNKGFVYNVVEYKTDSILEGVKSHWMSNLLYLLFHFLWLVLGWLSRLHDWIVQDPRRMKYQRNIQSKVLCCARLMLEHGADINAQQKDGRTPLHIAAGFETVYTDVVEFLLDSGAELEVRDEDGQTSLHEAAQAGFTGAVNLLVKRGAEVDARDSNMFTPLHFAAKYGHYQTVLVLLKSGADVSAQTSKGSTPLHLACALTNLGHVKVVALLLEHGADPNATNQKKESVLHVALRGRLKGVSDAHTHLLRVVGLLLDKFKNVNMGTVSNYTPLHEACAAGSPELVQSLLDRGASLKAADDRGRTPLHEAAEAGSQKVVQLLLNAGADLRAEDKERRTPSMWLANASWFKQMMRKGSSSDDLSSYAHHPAGNHH